MAWLTREWLSGNARYIVLMLLIALVVGALYFFRAVLLPFALSIFLAYLLAPVIDWLSHHKVAKWSVPRGAAILGVYAIILGVVALSGTYLYPRFYSEVNGMVKTLPATLHELEETFVRPVEHTLNRWVADMLPEVEPVEIGDEQEVHPPPNTPGTVTAEGNAQPTVQRGPMQLLADEYTFVVRRLDESRFEIVPQRRRVEANGTNGRQPFQFDRQISHAFTQLRESLEQNLIEFVLLGRRFVRVLVTSFFTLFLVLMLSGFLLLDPSRVHSFARSLIPSAQQRAYDAWLERLDHGLSGVVRGQALICLVNGILTGVGIAALGVPFVVTLSVIAAVFSLIPIFGVLISTVPILIMAATVSAMTALLALAWVLIIHFIEGNFLNPKILGDSAKIHPVLIVFALLVGEHFAGVLGALLAVPIFSLVQNSFLFLKHQAEAIDGAT